jgi:hypothetical protein
MSDIGSYVSRARQTSGEIRVVDQKKVEGEQRPLAKGNLGNKIASFFKGIGIALGMVKDTRYMRGKEAYEGFKSAMQKEYGTTIGNDALKQAGFKDMQRPVLTGSAVLKANDIAANLKREKTFNDSMKQGGVDRAGMSGIELKAIRDRFEAQVQPNDSADTRAKLAKTIADEVKTLSATGRLEKSIEAEKKFQASVKDALRTMGNGGNVQEVLAKGQAVHEAFVELSNVHGRRFDSVDNIDRLIDASHKAMEEIKREDPLMHNLILNSINSSQSSVEALGKSARDVVDANHDTATKGRRAFDTAADINRTLATLTEGVRRSAYSSTVDRPKPPKIDGDIQKQADRLVQSHVAKNTVLDHGPSQRLVDQLNFRAPSESKIWDGKESEQISNADLRTMLNANYRKTTGKEAQQPPWTEQQLKTIEDRKQHILDSTFGLKDDISGHISRMVRQQGMSVDEACDSLRNALIGDNAPGNVHALVSMAMVDHVEAQRTLLKTN